MAGPKKPPIYAPSDAVIIEAMMKYASTAQAAQALGIDEPYLKLRLKSELLKQAWRETRRDTVAQGRARLVYAYGTAVSVVLAIIAGKDTGKDMDIPPNVRLRACELVMNHTEQSIAMEDLEERVRNMEAKQGL